MENSSIIFHCLLCVLRASVVKFFAFLCALRGFARYPAFLRAARESIQIYSHGIKNAVEIVT